MKYRSLLLPLALAACSPAPPSSTDAGAPAHTASAATAPTPAGPATAAATPAATAATTEALSQFHWQLQQATSSDGKRIEALFVGDDTSPQLNFTQAQISVSKGCNGMSGSYQIKDGKLETSALAQTMMACANQALMAMDAAIGERLQAHPKVNLQTKGEVPQLTLVTDSGDTLQFHGKPTAETRYGGEGTTVFMEVAAQTKPCSHPLIPNMQCLQVRERHYDDKGLNTGTPGEWQPLYQDIEGYTHQAGVRNVLRLKRFSIKNPPADAPNTAYVLDMVVESEVVKP
jgi:heat shock protein HslJ